MKKHLYEIRKKESEFIYCPDLPRMPLSMAEQLVKARNKIARCKQDKVKTSKTEITVKGKTGNSVRKDWRTL